MLQSGRRSMPSIENWHFDTFHAVWRNREVAKAFVTFHLGTDGRPDELLVDFEGPITGVRTLVPTAPCILHILGPPLVQPARFSV